MQCIIQLILKAYPCVIKKIVLTFLLFWSFFVFNIQVSASLNCFLLFQPKNFVSDLSLDDLQSLKFATFNLKDFAVSKKLFDDKYFSKKNRLNYKSESEINIIADIILKNSLDIILLQEVQGYESINFFNENLLQARYKTLFFETNQRHGLGIAALIKNNLPFEIETRTHSTEVWVDNLAPGGGRTEKLFNRNFPALIFREIGADQKKPLFILFGAHFKSKRSRVGDEESYRLREAQIKRAGTIVDRFRNEFGSDVPILLAGDLNGDIHKDAVFDHLKKEAGLVESYSASAADGELPEQLVRATHSYFPRNGRAPQYEQTDAVLVSSFLARALLEIETYRYKDGSGQNKPFPRSFKERDENPSDHFPVFLTLDFLKMIYGVSKLER